MFDDFSLRDGRLVVKDTGATIPIDAGFLKDVYRAGSFIGAVAAIRAARDAKNLLLNSARNRLKIAFTPHKPRPWYAIWPVCKLAGLDFTKRPDEADILFHFEDRVSFTPPADTLARQRMLNGACTDISKSHVATIFKQVFGYDLAIDPLTHQGPALVKSEGNGVHDGEIIQCPIKAKKPGAVYQKLIENSLDGKIYTDIRTPIVGDAIPIIYLKQRRRKARISNENFRVLITDKNSVYTSDEQQKIIEFARAMKLDFGGLDILRDRHDGRLYIVDVNKTDMGPPTALKGPDKHRAIRALAVAFRQLLEATLEGETR